MNISLPSPWKDRLRQERVRRNWRQSDLAELLKTTTITINRWEQGKQKPGPHFRRKLCELFDKDAEELGFFTEKPPLSDNAEQQKQMPVVVSCVQDQLAVPKIWSIPYSHNPFFIGREHILLRMHEMLTEKRTPTLTQSLAISGLGGMGKTQIAIEYSYRYASDYAAVLWINAETVESITSSFAAIVELLDISEKVEQEQYRLMTGIIRWLNSHDRWLMIFDDVEEIDLVQQFLSTVRGGSLLFTSRRQTLGLTAHKLNVEKMPLEEGMRLLLHRSRLLDSTLSMHDLSLEDAEALDTIIATMDGLPLALDQAATYIEATRCNPSDYLQLLRSSPLRLLDEREAYGSHPLSLTRTFMLTLARLESTNALASELLTVCAFLAPESIPEEFFIKGAAQLGPAFEPLAVDAFLFQTTIKSLLAYSLLQRNAITHTLAIHRLVQTVLKERISEADQCILIKRLIYSMSQLFPAGWEGHANYSQACERLLPHALVCITFVAQFNEVSLEAIFLLCAVSHYLLNCSQLTAAEALLRHALCLAIQLLGSEHPQVTKITSELSLLATKQENYKEILPLCQSTLTICENAPGPQSPKVVNTCIFYANLQTMFHVKGWQRRD
ncbi:MAG TPA: helix-turn-helix transcriptional regulator [Ktedonobacteraceae bacterium]